MVSERILLLSVLSLLSLARLSSGQCIQLNSYSSPSTYGTVVRALTSQESLIKFPEVEIINGDSSRSGTIDFENVAASVLYPRFCRVEFYGENTDSRVTLSFSEFMLANSKLFIIDGLGPYRGDRIVTHTGSSVPGDFVSETPFVGVYFYYETNTGTGAKFTYSISEGNGDATVLDDDLILINEPTTITMWVTMAATVVARILLAVTSLAG